MKSLKQFIVTAFSTRSVGLFIFILTAIALTAILSGRYYLHNNIIENNVSKRDIYANKTIKIIDSEKTEKLKADIAKKITPIFVPIPDDYIRTNLEKNLAKIHAVRLENSTFLQKKIQLLSYFNLTSSDAVEAAQINYLLTISNAHFDRLELATKKTLNNILEAGITDTDIQENLSKTIKTNAVRHLSTSELNAVEFLVESIIEPNTVVDEVATEVSLKSALNSVKPVEVTIKAGNKIVSAGQSVSKLQKDALKKCGYNVIQLNVSGIIGIFILIFLALFVSAYDIENFETLSKRKAHYALLSLLMILFSTTAIFVPNNIWILPIAAYTILIGIFLNTRTALLTTILLICAIGLALQIEPEIIVLFIFGAFATVISLSSIKYNNRMELVKVGIITSIVYSLTATGAFFLQYNLEDLSFNTYWIFMIKSVANGIISSIIALGLLPILESMFKIPTQYGLSELANTNNPLLKELQEKAPGTHHHSQMVAIIAEAAAEAIGADVVLTKVGALYHDVGKINRPLFFIENQSYFGIENPHNQFTPKYSKMVITTHPRDGVEKAKEYKISPAVYPFILEHHGDSIASYFYNEAVKQEGADNVNEDEYRYNAPRPSSKESAIVMLADSVESAVRSLKNPTYEEMEAKISAVIKGKLLDGQLSDSPLTLKDLKTIANTFNKILKSMHHQRIKYQEDMISIQDKVLHNRDITDEN